jgi:hypothetical protein
VWWNVPDVPKPDWWGELAARIAADPDWYAKYAAAEFDRGNPYPLIGRLELALKRDRLSHAEIRSTIAALRAAASNQTKAELRHIEQKLIAIAVDRMVDEDGLTQKQAIAAVSEGLAAVSEGPSSSARRRSRCVRHIKAAIAAHGKRRNYRA